MAAGPRITTNASNLTEGTIPAARLPDASDSSKGALSGAFYILLNTATAALGVDTLVKRDSSNNVNVAGVIGGATANNVLTLQANSNSGNTATNSAIQLKTGNNGGTTAVDILHNGNVTFAGQVKAAAGSSSAPGIAFSAGAQTHGFYADTGGSGSLNVVAAGGIRLQLGTFGIITNNHSILLGTGLLTAGSTANTSITIQGNTASSGNTSTNVNTQIKVGNSGGTTALAALNNGYVGINTTSPFSPLNVYGGAFTLSANSSTTHRQQFDITPSWPTSTDASRKARVVYNVYDTAAREALRLEASGTAAMIGFLGASAVARPTVTGSRADGTALASLLTALANLGLITDSTTA